MYSKFYSDCTLNLQSKEPSENSLQEVTDHALNSLQSDKVSENLLDEVTDHTLKSKEPCENSSLSHRPSLLPAFDIAAEFQCPLCKFNTSHCSNLSRHMRSLHKGDARAAEFQCPLCKFNASHRTCSLRTLTKPNLN